jgi:hypothetical protein
MRVTDPEAQGLAMGACAHAIGTAASAEQGVTQGAFSSLAMVVCGVLTAAIAPAVRPLPLAELIPVAMAAPAAMASVPFHRFHPIPSPP